MSIDKQNSWRRLRLLSSSRLENWTILEIVVNKIVYYTRDHGHYTRSRIMAIIIARIIICYLPAAKSITDALKPLSASQRDSERQ